MLCFQALTMKFALSINFQLLEDLQTFVVLLNFGFQIFIKICSAFVKLGKYFYNSIEIYVESYKNI